MRRYLVAGNWKMNGGQESISSLMSELLMGFDEACASHCELLVCPSAPYLSLVAEKIEAAGLPIALGGQDCSAHQKGAYTGETAAGMLADLGCTDVIVGHSERRTHWAESSALVAQKFEMVQASGLRPILCVGETRAERELGKTADVVLEQLQAVLSRVGVDRFMDAVIAYEPVWAIGTGLNATPEQAQEVHAIIRDRIRKESVEVADAVTVLYGGSVKPENAVELFEQPDIDGALVGGASLNASSFLQIARSAVRLSSNAL